MSKIVRETLVMAVSDSAYSQLPENCGLIFSLKR